LVSNDTTHEKAALISARLFLFTRSRSRPATLTYAKKGFVATQKGFDAAQLSLVDVQIGFICMQSGFICAQINPNFAAHKAESHAFSVFARRLKAYSIRSA
jgi:hypothetical protein